MHRHGYIVAKCIIVQHIHNEEEDNIGQPFLQGDGSRLEEESRGGHGGMMWVREKRGQDKLCKGDEKAAVWLSSVDLVSAAQVL